MKKYIVGFVVLLLVSLVSLPSLTGAVSSVSSSKSYSSYSIEELETLIAKLQKQLEEMKKGAQCFASDKDLSLGDGESEESRDDVRRSQDFLIEKGYLNIKKSTGYFGKITRSSMMNFQKDSGIEQTGELNGATREKIKSLRCKTAVVNNSKKEAVSNEKQNKQETKSAVSKISLSGSGKSVSWKTDGYSKDGFKIVWSKNTGPTYPTRDGDKYIYFSDPSSSSATLEAFNGEGAYSVRVCEYLGGKCGVYSNEIILGL